MSGIDTIVVHYSATYDDQNITAADIDRMHRQRGWAGIGYHYFIRRDGTIERGRPETQLGAHVGGQNTGKLGTCYEGGLRRVTGPSIGVDTRTEAQNDALIRNIQDMLSRHPRAVVKGHRDLAATQCPGFDVIPWWAQVQRGGPPVIAPPASTETEVAGFGLVAVDWLNLRDAPGGKIIGGMPRGTSLTISARNGDWLRVTTPWPVTGWAHGDYIDIPAVPDGELARPKELAAREVEIARLTAEAHLAVDALAAAAR